MQRFFRAKIKYKITGLIAWNNKFWYNMKQLTTPERLLPLNIDSLERTIIKLRHEAAKHFITPISESVYMHPIDFEALIYQTSKLTKIETFINPMAASMNGIKIFSDPIVTPGTFFICEPGLFEIYKSLKSSAYVDKNWNDIQLQKVAIGLWESEKKSRDSPQFEWTFTEGEKFPTGAKYIPKIPIDFIDIKGQKF